MEIVIFSVIAFVAGFALGGTIGKNNLKNAQNAFDAQFDNVIEYYEGVVDELATKAEALQAKVSKKKTPVKTA